MIHAFLINVAVSIGCPKSFAQICLSNVGGEGRAGGGGGGGGGFLMEQLALSNVGLVLSIDVEFLCTFPWEAITSEMTITACLLIDWLTQIEFFNNSAWSQIKVSLNNI